MNFKVAGAIAALVAGSMLAASGARASLIYSEDFNNTAAFEGANIIPGVGNSLAYEAFSDKYNPAFYYDLNNADGWTFTGGAYYTTNAAGTDGAILLNETDPPTTASTTVSGLTVGDQYTLSFLLYGDNRPSQPWALNVDVGRAPVLSLTGADVGPAAYAGTTETVSFTALGTSTSLYFAQNTPGGSQASPIFDDVQITSSLGVETGVPEISTWAMMLIGFGLVGLRLKRRSAALAA
jgi:hypothetical protein